MQTSDKHASTHTLAIDGMSGDTCVTNVKSALHSVPTVKTQSVNIGSAVIDADQQGCEAACVAISGAGYRATENMSQKPGDKKPMSAVEAKAGVTPSDGTRMSGIPASTPAKPAAPKM
jgi:copper chaperone CopZ